MGLFCPPYMASNQGGKFIRRSRFLEGGSDHDDYLDDGNGSPEAGASQCDFSSIVVPAHPLAAP